MDIQRSQNHAQAHIALFKVGHSSHNLLISSGAASLLQLLSQGSQLSGVAGIVANHILHQRNQFFHGGVLVVRAAAGTTAAAIMVMMMVIVVVAVVMIMAVVMVVMVMVMIVAVIMIVMMVMVMIVAVIMIVMMVMIVVVMHREHSFSFFFYYTEKGVFVK